MTHYHNNAPNNTLIALPLYCRKEEVPELASLQAESFYEPLPVGALNGFLQYSFQASLPCWISAAAIQSPFFLTDPAAGLLTSKAWPRPIEQGCTATSRPSAAATVLYMKQASYERRRPSWLLPASDVPA